MTKDHSDLADVIVGLINHAKINGHRLSPLFGQQQGDLAVRVASLEAALEARPRTPETGRQRFEELMEGQDRAAVWRDRAFKLAEELDSASLHHPTGERITRKDLNNAFRQGRENGRLAAHALDGILSAATSKVVEQAREIRRMIDEGCDVRSNAVLGAMDDIIAALSASSAPLSAEAHESVRIVAEDEESITIAMDDAQWEDMHGNPIPDDAAARPTPSAVKVKPLVWRNIETHGGSAIMAKCMGEAWCLPTRGLRQDAIDEFKAKSQAECERMIRAIVGIGAGEHPDDIAVDRFAAAMKAKLARKRAEGRGGWEDKADCSQAFLSCLLREHVEKGDPVDVANLCMMLHQRGERIG